MSLMGNLFFVFLIVILFHFHILPFFLLSWSHLMCGKKQVVKKLFIICSSVTSIVVQALENGNIIYQLKCRIYTMRQYLYCIGFITIVYHFSSMSFDINFLWSKVCENLIPLFCYYVWPVRIRIWTHVILLRN